MASRVLWERGDELACISDRLDAAVMGDGATVLVEGAAGIGKSELLAAGRALAEERGVRVLHACGVELERDFGFGLTRQLLEPVFTDLDEGARSAVISGAAQLCVPIFAESPTGGMLDRQAALHGLYWLIANLTELGPLLVSVDDLHWVDSPSQELLAYLARRLSSLPVLLIAASRPQDSFGPAIDQLERVASTILQPSALSATAVHHLLDSEYGQPPDAEFVAACVRVTAGNPFLLHELIRTVRGDAVHPVAAEAHRLDRLAPRAITRAAVARLSVLSDAARRVALATAVLEPRAAPAWICRLAELDADAVTHAVDELVAADILADARPLSFAHPIIRSSLIAEMPSGMLSTEHKRAARIVVDDGADPELAATHLGQAECVGDPWTVATLISAAGSAISRGALAAGVAHLRRAAAEPPEAASRFQVLLQLGVQELAGQYPESSVHLEQALAAAPGALERTLATLALGQARLLSGDVASARQLVAALDDVPDLPLDVRLLIEAFAVALQMNSGPPTAFDESLESRAATLSGTTPAERVYLANVGLAALMVNRPSAAVVQIAERALNDDGHLDLDLPDEYSVTLPASLLLWSGQFSRADSLLAEMTERARTRGLVSRYMFGAGTRAMAALRLGDIALADSCSADVEQLLDAQTAPYLIPPLTAVRTAVALERDQPEAAGRIAGSQSVPEHLEGSPVSAYLYVARAQAALASRCYGEAAEQAQRAGLVLTKVGSVNPAVVDWRAPTVQALLAVGDPERARAVAAEGLRLAESFGATHAIGNALRSLAATDADRREAHLTRAIEALKDSEARLDLGYASIELGACLRASGQRTLARAHLLRALDISTTTGSQHLERISRLELSALGLRPRRSAQSGVGALTGGEIRVARMAADGLTNAEIAQALFVTTKTVETHLYRVYRKLDITSRAELHKRLGN